MTPQNEMFTYVSPFGVTRHPVEGQKGHLRRASNGSHNYHHRGAPRRLLACTDIVNRLDDMSPLQNHHEGPYDAACAVQNNCGQSSPVAALRNSNVEILKVDDSLHEGSNMIAELDMGFMWDPKMKFTSVDFANDPFYSDRSRPLRRIGKKALSLCKRLWRATAGSA